MEDNDDRTCRPLLVIGTRPDSIKMAPIVLDCLKRNGVVPIVCSTGQHPRLVETVARFFGFEIGLPLSVFESGQALGRLMGRTTTALAGAIEQTRPDCVVAVGDTTTTAATATAAFLQGAPFIHVEAGLRTGRLDAPWPEEFNRRLASLAAAWHCAPTETDARRLADEGVDAARIIVCGNPIVDALTWTVARLRDDKRRHQRLEQRFGRAGGKPRVVVTCHRRESHGTRFASVLHAIGNLATHDLVIVFPVHPNPHVRGPAHAALGELTNVQLTEPLDYPDFIWLMSRAAVVLTDSGGIQEEALSLGVPLVVMRDVTERYAGLRTDSGMTLVGTDPDAISSAVLQSANRPPRDPHTPLAENPYGDGQAARRIVDLLVTMNPRIS